MTWCTLVQTHVACIAAMQSDDSIMHYACDNACMRAPFAASTIQEPRRRCPDGPNDCIDGKNTDGKSAFPTGPTQERRSCSCGNTYPSSRTAAENGIVRPIQECRTAKSDTPAHENRWANTGARATQRQQSAARNKRVYNAATGSPSMQTGPVQAMGASASQRCCIATEACPRGSSPRLMQAGGTMSPLSAPGSRRHICAPKGCEESRDVWRCQRHSATPSHQPWIDQTQRQTYAPAAE